MASQIKLKRKGVCECFFSSSHFKIVLVFFLSFCFLFPKNYRENPANNTKIYTYIYSFNINLVVAWA